MNKTAAENRRIFPHHLVDAIGEGRVVAFVGSGLSSGGPTWLKLLEGVSAAAETERPDKRDDIRLALKQLDAGEFLDAADTLRGVLGKHFSRVLIQQVEFRHTIVRASNSAADGRLFRRYVRAERRVYEPQVTHYNLLGLGLRTIITTNYDDTLENADSRPAAYRCCSYSHPHLAKHIGDGRRVILKAHGDLNHTQDIVLARSDYERIAQNKNLRLLLQGHLGEKVVLWIGYGFNDPDIGQLLELLSKRQLSGGYALVGPTAAQTDRVAKLEALGVIPLMLNSFKEVPELIRDLAEQTAEKFCSRIVLDRPWFDHVRARRLGVEIESALDAYVGEFEFIRGAPIHAGDSTIATELVFRSTRNNWATLRALVQGEGAGGFAELLAGFQACDVDFVAPSNQRSQRRGRMSPTNASPIDLNLADATDIDRAEGETDCRPKWEHAYRMFSEGRLEEALEEARLLVTPYTTTASALGACLAGMVLISGDRSIGLSGVERASQLRHLLANLWRSQMTRSIRAKTTMQQAILYFSRGEHEIAESLLDYARRYCLHEDARLDSASAVFAPFEREFIATLVRGRAIERDKMHREPWVARLYRGFLDVLRGHPRARQSIVEMTAGWKHPWSDPELGDCLDALRESWNEATAP